MSIDIRQRRTILLVEDNVDDERITLRALRRNNVMDEVVVACDGRSAIDFLAGKGEHAGRDTSDKPDLVILDLHLPGLGGLQVLEWIRSDSNCQHIPVVMFSSSESEKDVADCYRMGTNSYVRKPDDIDEFSDAILQISMYWLLLNRSMRGRVLV